MLKAKKEKLTPYEASVINDFISSFRDIDFIEMIVLYGSRSTGESTEFSDMDIAIIVDSKAYVRGMEKMLERWNIEYSPEIMIHFLVMDIDSIKKAAIGSEIMKGDILWSRQFREAKTFSV